MNINDLGLRLNGRSKQPVTAVQGKDLTLEDLQSLSVERATKAPTVKSFRERHHALARALASGQLDGDAGVLCGYSTSRVSILKTDPSFVDLIEHYRGVVDDKYYGMHERMAGLGQDAVDELQERLDDEPEKFSNGQLMELASRMADRTGHGPTTKTDVNVKIGLADRLADARKRVANYTGNTIEGEVVAT